MTREKIIELAYQCDMAVSQGGNGYWDNYKQLESFYHVAQAEAFEAAASRCDVLGNNGVGGFTCAAAIREMAKENGK